MNKSLLILLIGSSILHAHNEKLESAVEKQDSEKIAQLLSRQTLKPEEMTSAINLAQEKLEESQQNVSLLKSKRDAAKFIGGAVVALPSLAVALYAGRNGYLYLKEYLQGGVPLWISQQGAKEGARICFTVAAVAAIPTIIGGYLAVKGFRCSSAVAKVTKAKEIVELLKKKTN